MNNTGIIEAPSKQNKKIALIISACCAVLPLLFTAMGQSYPILIMCYLEIYIIAVSGLDLLFGYSGQISMGHAAFYAIGAYGSALLHNYFSIPVVISMLIAVVAATIVGIILAIPASRLTFHFLSLSTIALGEIVYQLISHSPNDITGNFRGIFSESISIFGLVLDKPILFFYFGFICMIAILVLKTNIVDSKIGRAFMAIRENAHAANGMGINVRRYKVIAFAFSAMFVSLAGAMYMHLVGYASPDTFTQKQSVMFITMLLFGGTACLTGPILGAFFILILTELLRGLQSYQLLIYGALMLIIIVAMPGGLNGGIKDIFNKIKRKREEKNGNAEN